MITYAIFSRTPINWRTPLGYLTIVSNEYFAFHFAAIVFTAVLCVFVGSSLLLKLFIEDATNDLNCLNIENDETLDGNALKEMKMRFSNTVQDHSDLKQLCTVLFQYKFFCCRLNRHFFSSSLTKKIIDL